MVPLAVWIVADFIDFLLILIKMAKIRIASQIHSDFNRISEIRQEIRNLTYKKSVNRYVVKPVKQDH